MQYPYENLVNFTLDSLLDRSVSLYAEKPVLANVGQEPINYGEMYSKVQDMIQLLHEHGISKGDKVLLLSENMPNWSIAYFSITYIGAVVVPVLVDFHPSDVHHIIRHSEAKAVFVSSKHQAVIEECEGSSIEFVINLDELKLIEDMGHKGYISRIKELKNKITNKDGIEKPSEDDLAAIIYTSGTTGHSKGVMLSHKNIVSNALSVYCKIIVVPEDRFLSILPLAHTLECTVGMVIPILHGCSIHYIDKAPTPSVLLKAFQVVKPTIIISVPLIMEKIYKTKILPKFTSSALIKNIYKVPFIRKKLNKIAGKKLINTFGGEIRFFVIGGAPFAPYVEKFLSEAEFPYVVGYGLTETAPMLSGGIKGTTQVVRSAGTPFVGVDIDIRDKNPQTGAGEIYAKGPNVMMGYYKDSEKTAEVLQDGWFATGDLGYLDENNYLFISGRSKNVIIGPSGENIYPEQIESVINRHKTVVASLVMEQNGKLVARVHLDYDLIDKMFEADHLSDSEIKEKIDNLLEEMRLEVNSQVSSFSKMVKFIEQIDPFIETPTKKIKRYLYTE